MQAYAEGALSPAERGLFESHLEACARCSAATVQWQALFLALAALPRLAPAPGFADRVLAQVHARVPLVDRLLDWLDRLVPRTTGGWAVATAFLALPVLLVGGVVAWILATPWLTFEGLWLFLRGRASTALLALAERAGDMFLGSQPTLWVANGIRAVAATGALDKVGLVIAALATVTLISIWVLYHNLFRSPTRGSTYGTYCF